MNTDVFSALNVDRRKMLLAKAYATLLSPLRLFVFFDVVLSAKLVLVAVLLDLDPLRFFAGRPVDQYREARRRLEDESQRPSTAP